MKKNFLFQLLLAAFLLPAFSCSDDDSAPEINNATTLNMLDVENGATRLGNSDIYINAANYIQIKRMPDRRNRSIERDWKSHSAPKSATDWFIKQP